MKRTDNFSKFAARKSNAAIKEEFRQEKKKFKKERSEAIEKKKLEFRKAAAEDKDVSKNRSESSDLRPAITVRKQDKTMPLNKYVAHCGICSRRDAVPLIKEGKMRVNDVVILEPGFKVNPNDVVSFGGKKIVPEKNLVYILLNKPKDYITTLDDPEGRKTVLDLLRGVTAERIFPIGRLDRNTTGVLLLTNDGDLTQKLSHPSHEVRKIYEVKLDKPLGKLDFERILIGLDLEDGFVNPPWDPTGEYSMPWQAGMAGIAYNIDVTGREIKSVADLFAPEFKGKIGMLTEMRDTIGLICMSLGIDPSKITSFEDAAPAFEKLAQAKADGQIRAFTGNDYTDDLVSGNFAACVGWSGDVLQLGKDSPNVRFVIPEEGGTRWCDTMILPKGVKNSVAAAKWMNFCYDPVQAAQITQYVQYLSPVKGVRDELAKLDPELAENPLLFPDDAANARLRAFATLSEDVEAKFDEEFSAITGA